ncbi:type II toxin-antitoxin system VapC family toxin [Streptomyces luteogriseus]|uniref:type II toxin-antitoxin system VapC family toxin n=1 Tax=Streptomyces luteogriseus TaxID=68233 RepID=UPI002E38147F|nr:PIN domain-containing protein [Streptomyces luteogriseus]WTJ28306.1 PIN domain-containing protein [Streptomyces luteogriseus]
MIATVLDTGPLAAAFNAADRRHPECASLLTSLTGRRLLPPVMTEVCWLLERWPRVEAAFLAEVARGTFELVHLTPTDLTRMAELVLQYADFPLGGVDALVIAVAERFGVDRVATLDRRHFSVVKPDHVPALTLLP